MAEPGRPEATEFVTIDANFEAWARQISSYVTSMHPIVSQQWPSACVVKATGALMYVPYARMQ